jgi:hypothetical protein
MPLLETPSDYAGKRFIHYKGGHYFVLGVVARHEHNGDLDVVYISLTHGKMVTRPFNRDSRNEDSWTDLVRWLDGKERPRFTHESCLSEGILAACFGSPTSTT